MTGPRQRVRRSLCVGVSMLAIVATGCSMVPKGPAMLSGSQESPPVTTNASGTTDISVSLSRCPSSASSANCPTVYGTVVTTGVAATAAHIHMAAAGQNGPVVVPLVKVSDNVWAVPGGTALNDDQWRAYWAGQLYVNVHSDANKGGEIRAQLKP
jgi:CHRD domain-containing protein